MQGPRPQIESLGDPDEVITLVDTLLHTVRIGDRTFGRLVLQPRWRWSTHVRPMVSGGCGVSRALPSSTRIAASTT